jgi:vacuolar-type H+-ATPase subunit D/Vma8
MTADEDVQGLALLGEVREQLLNELVRLADKRKDLEAQLEAALKELYVKEVDVEVKATRRMLGLVEATEQDLAAQGQEDLEGPESTGKEVRGGGSAESAIPL